MPISCGVLLSQLCFKGGCVQGLLAFAPFNYPSPQRSGMFFEIYYRTITLTCLRNGTAATSKDAPSPQSASLFSSSATLARRAPTLLLFATSWSSTFLASTASSSATASAIATLLSIFRCFAPVGFQQQSNVPQRRSPLTSSISSTLCKTGVNVAR